MSLPPILTRMSNVRDDSGKVMSGAGNIRQSFERIENRPDALGFYLDVFNENGQTVFETPDADGRIPVRGGDRQYQPELEPVVTVLNDAQTQGLFQHWGIEGVTGRALVAVDNPEEAFIYIDPNQELGDADDRLFKVSAAGVEEITDNPDLREATEAFSLEYFAQHMANIRGVPDETDFRAPSVLIAQTRNGRGASEQDAALQHVQDLYQAP